MNDMGSFNEVVVGLELFLSTESIVNGIGVDFRVLDRKSSTKESQKGLEPKHRPHDVPHTGKDAEQYQASSALGHPGQSRSPLSALVSPTNAVIACSLTNIPAGSVCTAGGIKGGYGIQRSVTRNKKSCTREEILQDLLCSGRASPYYQSPTGQDSSKLPQFLRHSRRARCPNLFRTRRQQHKNSNQRSFDDIV